MKGIWLEEPAGYIGAKKEIVVLDFVSLLVLFVIRPREAMDRIRERVSPIAAVIALLLTGIANAVNFRLLDIRGFVSSLGVTSDVLDAVVEMQKTSSAFWAFVSEPFFLMFAAVMIMDAAAQAFWKKRAGSRLYVTLSLSGLVEAVIRLIGMFLSGMAGGVLSDVLTYGAIIYSLIMGVMAVRFYYEKSTARALGLYLLPTALTLAVTLTLVLVLGGGA